MTNLIHSLRERGFLENLTDPAIDKICQEEQVVVYCGFDPTADSLHIGSLLPILLLMHFQRAGHKPIALVGGATGLIGDPSGKKDERTLLSREDVRINAEGIRQVLSRFLDFGGENAATIVNNLDWMGEFRFVDFIRDIGKHVRITEMLARDSVKSRLDSGTGLSFTEFSYQILQAYDFYHLYKENNCRVQVGGADQWGNITAGTDLIRRLTGEQAYGSGLAAPDHRDRTEVRQNGGGGCLADRRPNQPVSVLSVLGSDRRPGCDPFPQTLHLPLDGRDWRVRVETRNRSRET